VPTGLLGSSAEGYSSCTTEHGSFNRLSTGIKRKNKGNAKFPAKGKLTPTLFRNKGIHEKNKYIINRQRAVTKAVATNTETDALNAVNKAGLNIKKNHIVILKILSITAKKDYV